MPAAFRARVGVARSADSTSKVLLGAVMLPLVGDHEEVRDFELAPGWGQGSADGESWPQSVDKAAIFLCR